MGQQTKIPLWKRWGFRVMPQLLFGCVTSVINLTCLYREINLSSSETLLHPKVIMVSTARQYVQFLPAGNNSPVKLLNHLRCDRQIHSPAKLQRVYGQAYVNHAPKHTLGNFRYWVWSGCYIGHHTDFIPKNRSNLGELFHLFTGTLTSLFGSYPHKFLLQSLNSFSLTVRSVPAWEVATKITINVLIMAVAIIGNLAVVIVVVRNKRMQTTTNYYLVNLAISDLMVTLSCTWVHMVDDLTEGMGTRSFLLQIQQFHAR